MLDIVIILGLILLNGVFSMSELAVVSARRIRLKKLAERGSRGAHAALALADSPSLFLSTVQVGITLISIFNGAFGEASLVARLTPWIAAVAALSAYAREISLGIVVIAITFASIILGELVPKRIAMQHPELMATLVAAPLRDLSRLMGPFVKVLSVTTDLVMRLLGMQQPRNDALTKDEIAGMIKQGSDAGVVEKTEYDIATRALRLDDRRLKALMTPRVSLDFINLNEDLEKNLAKIANRPYGRFPVYSSDRSHILGVVHAGDLFEQAIRHRSVADIDIASVTKPALYVPESVSTSELLALLKKNRSELALVVDKHGEIKGMVTLNDLLLALVGGDVAALEHVHGDDAVRRDDGSWLMDGAMPLDRCRMLLDTDEAFPAESPAPYRTLAGFALSQLAHIPKVSERFNWNAYRFEIVDMDGDRIDRLLVSKLDAVSR